MIRLAKTAAAGAQALSLEGPDIVALVVSVLLGMFASTYIPKGPWAGPAAVFLSYHLFLFWLMFTAYRDPGTKLSWETSIFTHLAIVAVVCGGVLVSRSIPYFYLLRYIPFFGFLRFGIAALAVYERNFLLSGVKKVQAKPETRNAAPVAAPTGQEYEEFLHYMANRGAMAVAAGTSIKDEYQKWLAKRPQRRPVMVSESESLRSTASSMPSQMPAIQPLIQPVIQP